jgi:hypothetical protein
MLREANRQRNRTEAWQQLLGHDRVGARAGQRKGDCEEVDEIDDLANGTHKQ